MTQKLARYTGVVCSLALLMLAMVGGAEVAYAQQCTTGTPDSRDRCVQQRIQSECSGSPDSIERCAQNIRSNEGATASGDTPQLPDGLEPAVDEAFSGCREGSTEDGCGFIDKYLNPLINLLAAAAGMVVIIMIIVGGIQYASAGGDASKVAAAKSRIANAILAIVAFLFLYAVLQWLVPGGFF